MTATTATTRIFDPAQTRGGGPREAVRSFVAAARIGWAVDANWTDPVLFGIYIVAKPLSAALILVFMVQVISGGTAGAFTSYVIVGSALWSLVLGGISGLAWSILDDRERYRMIKYLYVSPADFILVLLGRGIARVAAAGVGTLITLVVGIVLLGVAFDPLQVDWPLLVVVMAMGLVTIVALALLLAGVCLQTRQESWSYPDAVAGALLLISGPVFPLAVLPTPLQALGLLSPLTWWIAGVRLALFPEAATSVGGGGSLYEQLTGQLTPGPLVIVVALLVTGAVGTLAAFAVFRLSEQRAKDRGLLDQTTGS
jgi:ABC-2 type transport system permease protein